MWEYSLKLCMQNKLNLNRMQVNGKWLQQLSIKNLLLHKSWLSLRGFYTKHWVLTSFFWGLVGGWLWLCRGGRGGGGCVGWGLWMRAFVWGEMVLILTLTTGKLAIKQFVTACSHSPTMFYIHLGLGFLWFDIACSERMNKCFAPLKF